MNNSIWNRHDIGIESGKQWGGLVSSLASSEPGIIPREHGRIY